MNSTWETRASMKLSSESDCLRKVLDPNDEKGIKNLYIDEYLKFYLMKHLVLQATDNIAEIGSGIGRLTEFIANYCNNAYGIDIIEKFVNDCNVSSYKRKNTSYFCVGDLDEFPGSTITKFFFVWVLMYFQDTEQLVSVLREYSRLFSNSDKAVVIEQVKISAETEYLDGNYYCTYRTIAEYVEIFDNAGYSVVRHFVLGERVNGILAKFSFNRLFYPLIPSQFKLLGKIFFQVDKYLMNIGVVRRAVRNKKNRPVDVVFELVRKNVK